MAINFEYVLGHFFTVTSMPVRLLSETDNSLVAAFGYPAAADPLESSDLKRSLLQKAANTAKPFMTIEGDFCTYGTMHGPEGGLVILGPVMLRQLSNQEIQEFAFRHRISPRDLISKAASLVQVAAAMSLLSFLLTGEPLNEGSIAIDNAARAQLMPLSEDDVKTYMLQNVENEITHISLQNEVSYLQLIKEGNVEAITGKADPGFNYSSVGILAKKSFKHYEYMICSSIALATRAAIEGGLDQATAYSMSDLYLQRLELCNTIEDIVKVQLDMKVAFVRQVRKARDNRCAKSYVEKCKIIVANNLNKPIELDEIAKALGVNKAYLARKFKSETGMGVMQYLRSKRIEAATRMLKYSDEPIAAVASYFCFATQSHFGQVFREFMATSPQKYRDNASVL
ncbi:MAG TPA: hypothetical protein DCM45_07160 [Clostridiales bacterium]|nr:hypothetical protein [Clostridiales bacterium]